MTGGSVTGNEKYAISETAYDGEVFAVGRMIPYRNGNGHLREIVVKVRGLFSTPAYVPVTLFGLDAEQVNETAVGGLVRVTGRLNSRQYEDRNGNIRWNLQITGSKVDLVQKAMQPPEPERRNETVSLDDPNLPDDIPF